ncbi:MAG: prepilin-type N-terminal cleavage/methylation domain-containing protein [Bacteroidota bacterium]
MKHRNERAAGRSGRESGFTLVEILVVLVIMAVALVGIAWSFSAGIRASALASRKRIAVLLAQKKLEETRLAGLEPALETGDFLPDYPGYTWRLEVSGPDAEGLYRLEVAVAWPDRGRDRQETLVTYVPPAPGAELGGAQS